MLTHRLRAEDNPRYYFGPQPHWEVYKWTLQLNPILLVFWKQKI